MTWFRRNPSCRILPVEKTDRLYRNLRDAVTLEDLDIETHLVKEGQIISKDAKSQAKLIHGIHLVMAKNYSENLREEVKKGLREKALTGVYPGNPPFGYKVNKAERIVEVHPVKSVIVSRMFELYATGTHSTKSLSKAIHLETEFASAKGTSTTSCGILSMWGRSHGPDTAIRAHIPFSCGPVFLSESNLF
jgi:site-specific DNA recombinase